MSDLVPLNPKRTKSDRVAPFGEIASKGGPWIKRKERVGEQIWEISSSHANTIIWIKYWQFNCWISFFASCRSLSTKNQDHHIYKYASFFFFLLGKYTSFISIKDHVRVRDTQVFEQNCSFLWKINDE